MGFLSYTREDRADSEKWAALKEMAAKSGDELVPAVVQSQSAQRIAEFNARTPTISASDDRAFRENLAAIAAGKVVVG